MSYRLVFILFALVFLSCHKHDEPIISPSKPSTVDSISGVYKGTMHLMKEKAYVVPPGVLQTDRWDSSYYVEFTVTKIDSKHFKAVLPGYIDSLVFETRDNTSQYGLSSAGDHEWFVLYPPSDTCTYNYEYYSGYGGPHDLDGRYFVGVK